ncbi:uncharacterized protein EI90DRAFT_3041483 [Cantharellus anzutake]|uniref:uncharacterized protein n=1 Tax=Cantharellus anzutake TaxID=1750568 RepID=UPI001906D94E|nr:uncharacterized protein EI90DRAFT_3041483 [Cantharellus anzutake]KAF8338066.1 hypothetical protein EI90DRAFT_3041483 [Cantharellus anzutake]
MQNQCACLKRKKDEKLVGSGRATNEEGVRTGNADADSKRSSDTGDEKEICVGCGKMHAVRPSSMFKNTTPH